MRFKQKWEGVVSHGYGYGTSRLQVPGGWLVKHVERNSEDDAVVIVFVADPEYQWEVDDVDLD